jgi:hypothetical protein
VEADWGRVEDAEICAEAAFFLASRKDKGGFWDLLEGVFLFFLPKQVLGMGLALSWRCSKSKFLKIPFNPLLSTSQTSRKRLG